jgi:hypothetical protein
MPYPIQKYAIIIDIVPNPIVANTNTPGSDSNIRQLATLIGIFLEAFKHLEHTSMSLHVELPKITPKPIGNDEAVRRHARALRSYAYPSLWPPGRDEDRRA